MKYVYYLVVLVIGLLIYKVYNLFKVPKEIKNIPSVPFLSLLWSILSGEAYDQEFEKVYRPALSKFGFARIWMFGSWEVIVTDPKHAQEVLSDADLFPKEPGGDENVNQDTLVFKYFGRSGITLSDGEEWRRHRRIINPAFKKSLNVELFTECALELIELITHLGQRPTILDELFRRLTLDVLGRGLFSYNFEAIKKGEKSHYLVVYNEIMSAIFNPVYYIFPVLENWVPSRRYYHRKNTEFRKLLLHFVKERQVELENGIVKDDLLSLIIKASCEENEENTRLTDEEVLNNLSSFFMAGQDTTSYTLITTFYYLARYPEIQHKLLQEIFGILGYDGKLKIPTSEQLKPMKYLDCIIKESMRIMTTAPFLRRYCTNSTTLSGGLLIPSETYVHVHLWTIHHDPQLFPNPYTFCPDRFKEVHGSQDRAWMAFGDGSRKCMGMNFSLMEQRVTMVLLLQQFQVKLGPNASKVEEPFVKAYGLAHLTDVDVEFIPRQ